MKSLYNTTPAATTVNAVRNNTRATRVQPKYDEKFGKDAEASFAGVFFMVIPILFIAFCLLTSVKNDGYEMFMTVVATGALVLRVIATVWVEKISKELNRNTTQWMTLAFFLPGTALTIIGQKKKLYNPEEWRKHLYQNTRTVSFGKAAHTAQPQSLQLAS